MVFLLEGDTRWREFPICDTRYHSVFQPYSRTKPGNWLKNMAYGKISTRCERMTVRVMDLIPKLRAGPHQIIRLSYIPTTVRAANECIFFPLAGTGLLGSCQVWGFCPTFGSGSFVRSFVRCSFVRQFVANRFVSCRLSFERGWW